jgi:hypothetical protein
VRRSSKGAEIVTKVIIDERTRAQFHDLNEALQFFDESGHLLGLFTPSVDPSLLRPQIDDVEIQNRLRMGGGRPLSEILGDLGKRA